VDLAQLEKTDEAPRFFSAETRVHEIAPRMYHVRQRLEQADGTLSAAETTYYRLLTESLAEMIAKELVKSRPGSLGVSPHRELAPVEAPELDGFWWVRSDVGVQYAVARLGKEILEIQYEGPADLRQHAAYFAQLLA